MPNYFFPNITQAYLRSKAHWSVITCIPSMTFSPFRCDILASFHCFGTFQLSSDFLCINTNGSAILRPILLGLLNVNPKLSVSAALLSFKFVMCLITISSFMSPLIYGNLLLVSRSVVYLVKTEAKYILIQNTFSRCL